MDEGSLSCVFFYLLISQRGSGGRVVKPLGSASVRLARVLATLITLAIELYP